MKAKEERRKAIAANLIDVQVNVKIDEIPDNITLKPVKPKQQQNNMLQQQQTNKIPVNQRLGVNKQPQQRIQQKTIVNPNPNSNQKFQTRSPINQNKQNIIQVTQLNQRAQQNISPKQIFIMKSNDAAQLQQSQPPRRVVLNSNVTLNKTPRKIVFKNPNQETNEDDKQKEDDNLSSFLVNRKVIESATITTVPGTGGTVDLGQTALLKTPVVTVSNLSAGMTDDKIRKLCQGLGPIQVRVIV